MTSPTRVVVQHLLHDTLPRIDHRLRLLFLETAAHQLDLVSAERGIALDHHTRDHVRRSLARVAVQRALQLCHILTVTGREYRQCLPASAA